MLSNLVGIIGALVDRLAQESQRVAPKQTRNSYVLLPKSTSSILCNASIVVRYADFRKDKVAEYCS